MRSRAKLEREALHAAKRELLNHGVRDWSIRRTAGNHLQLLFEHEGRRLICVLSGSGDWLARRNTRTKLRAMLSVVEDTHNRE